jgi:hypothetical protein
MESSLVVLLIAEPLRENIAPASLILKPVVSTWLCNRATIKA